MFKASLAQKLGYFQIPLCLFVTCMLYVHISYRLVSDHICSGGEPAPAGAPEDKAAADPTAAAATATAW